MVKSAVVKGIGKAVKGSRGTAVKAEGKTKGQRILDMVNATSGGKAKAESEFGKPAVAQAIRRAASSKAREAAKATKETDKKINERGVGAMPALKRRKMTRQQKAEAAYKRVVKANKPVNLKKAMKDYLDAGGKISTLPPKKVKQYREEMEKELRGQTDRGRRERLKEATDKNKQRKARQLTQGRESDEAFEARMSREARQGGGADVGRRRAQRGSVSDPLYDLEVGQANRALRGRDELEPRELTEVIRKKGGTVKLRKGGSTVKKPKKKTANKPRGVGCATRGYGKAMNK